MKYFFISIIIFCHWSPVFGQISMYEDIIKSDSTKVKSITKYKRSITKTDSIVFDSILAIASTPDKSEFYDANQFMTKKIYYNKKGELIKSWNFHYTNDTLTKIINDTIYDSYYLWSEIQYDINKKIKTSYFKSDKTETSIKEYDSKGLQVGEFIVSDAGDTTWAEYLDYDHMGHLLSRVGYQDAYPGYSSFFFHNDDNSLKRSYMFDEEGDLKMSRKFHYLSNEEYIVYVKDHYPHKTKSGKTHYKKFKDNKGNICKIYTNSFYSPGLWHIEEFDIEYYK